MGKATGLSDKSMTEMAALPASRVRIPPEDFNRVVYNGERIKISRNRKESVFLVSEEDLKLLEAVEDLIDIQLAEEVLAKGGKPVPLEEARKRLGL